MMPLGAARRELPTAVCTVIDPHTVRCMLLTEKTSCTRANVAYDAVVQLHCKPRRMLAFWRSLWWSKVTVRCRCPWQVGRLCLYLSLITELPRRFVRFAVWS